MKRETGLRLIEAKSSGKPDVRADIHAYLNLVFDREVPEHLPKGIMVEGISLWEKVPQILARYQLSLRPIQEGIRSFGPSHFESKAKYLPSTFCF